MLQVSLSNNDFCFSADKVHAAHPTFRRFRRQLFHSSLSKILSSLRPVMEKPEVVECSDGHYRRAIWGLGPYSGDYPEQVLLTCVVQGWCPKSDDKTLLLVILYLIILCRCQATHENLDNEDLYQRRRTKDRTEALINTYEVPILWSEHGIISDVIVRSIASIFFPVPYSSWMLALHQWLSTSWYTRTCHPGSPSSNHQRHL